MIDDLRLLLLTSALLVASTAVAQKLPVPSRTVFKCELEGKVVYSDSPCLGAKKIEVEPTRGLDKSSGIKRTGKDVREERMNEILTEALRPITGMDSTHHAKAIRRHKLAPLEKSECYALDIRLSREEQAESKAKKPELAGIQSNLFSLRKRYRELGC